MTDLNNVSLGGRITRDAKLEKTKDGVSMLRFGIAVNRSQKNGDQYEDYVSFIEFAPIYGSYAENMAKHLKKGVYCNVEGHVRTNYWESDGKKHQELQIVPHQGKINPWIERRKAESTETAEEGSAAENAVPEGFGFAVPEGLDFAPDSIQS